MKIRNDEDFGSVLVCAVRYALGRRTYMPSVVADFVSSIAGELSVRTLTVIKNDILAAKDRNMLGDENIDAPVWLDLLHDREFFLAGGARTEDVTKVGGRIKFARKKAGLTQKQLADKCWIHHSYISGFERGNVKPKPYLIDRIAAALGVSVEYLVQGDNT